MKKKIKEAASLVLFPITSTIATGKSVHHMARAGASALRGNSTRALQNMHKAKNAYFEPLKPIARTFMVSPSTTRHQRPHAVSTYVTLLDKIPSRRVMKERNQTFRQKSREIQDMYANAQKLRTQLRKMTKQKQKVR